MNFDVFDVFRWEEIFVNEELSAIGEKYRDGDGVEQDTQKAIEFFTRAKDWLALGKIYHDGIGGIERDLQKADEYYSKIEKL